MIHFKSTISKLSKKNPLEKSKGFDIEKDIF